MTFRPFHHTLTLHRLLLCLLVLGAVSWVFPANSEAQQLVPRRRVLAFRGMNRLSLSILRTRASGTSPLRVAHPRLVALPTFRPNFNSNRTSPRVLGVPRFNASPSSSIALGAYFYQDGQCAPGDNGAVRQWQTRAGRLPAVWLIFQSWTGWNAFPTAQARRARQLGGKLLVTWEPWSGGGDSGWNCNLIAGGKRDAYIRQYARDVKSAGVPVMIRFAHEMNGDWYPWGTAFGAGMRRHNGNSPQDYVAMWRRVVSIFRAEGATNAQWVWAPNIHFLNVNNSLSGQNSDLAALYPGDNYVDWIGLSVYNDASRRNWRTFSDLFDGAYRTVTQISSKPLMIAEMGVTEVGAPYGTSKAAWISQTLLRDIPVRYPRVKLVNWFCRDKTNQGEANYRFDSSASSLQAFRYAVNLPLYGARLSGN
ncbi:glycoside hydrolase family 26 protein [Abditibacterium utsteinense]|nr:glycosyl hydrolase [Abditibacterium utsteinense]